MSISTDMDVILGATFEKIGFSKKEKRVETKRFDPHTGQEFDPFVRTHVESITVGNRIIEDFHEFIWEFEEDELCCFSSNFAIQGITPDFPLTTVVGLSLADMDTYSAIVELPEILPIEKAYNALKKAFGYEGEIRTYIVTRWY